MLSTCSYLLMITITVTTVSQHCGYHFAQKNVTFDISSLILTNITSSKHYYNVTSTEYQYLFNFCTDVLSAPSLCTFNDKLYNDKVYADESLRIRSNNASSFAFQYNEEHCFRLSGSNKESIYDINQHLINYQLIDTNDPSFGFIIHYYYGDYCGYQWGGRGHINRELKIAIVCDPVYNDIYPQGLKVLEPETCVYELEIKSIYGCPLECGRDVNDNLCSNKGVCGYDYDSDTALCFCFGGYQGDYCNETTAFYGNASWYDSITVNNESNYIYEFNTIYGYNVTYDLQHIVDGYLSDAYYRFNDMSASNVYFVNLFDSLKPMIDALGICKGNDESYDVGYILQTIPYAPNAVCYSLGRNPPNIQLYDETLPTKGVTFTYTNGDNTTCDEGKRANIYFICPDSNQYEHIDAMNGLNDIFARNHMFYSDETDCEYNIEILTSTACPYQCVTYDDTYDTVSQCNANGVCAYDFALNVIRCLCTNQQDDIQCYNPNITYSPTLEPTLSPTIDPNIDIKWYQNAQFNYTSPYLYEFESIYGYNISYDLQYIVNGYLNGKYYILTDEYRNPYDYYINLFNKTVGADGVKGICDNNIADYDYGYIFQVRPNKPLDKCWSLGRIGPIIQLYDDTQPTKGIRISYHGGDKTYCDNKRRTDINLLCPDDGGYFERYQSDIGLNNIYSNYKFYESDCVYTVDIYTSAACAVPCIVYNEEKDSISQCTTNGICQYDNAFDLIRCVCNDNMKITSQNDIHCANDNITYAPTLQPTKSPTTAAPTYNPTLPPYIVWINDIQPDNTSHFIFQFATNYGYNVTYDLQYIVMGYLDDKYYKIRDYLGNDVYFNLFNSTNTCGYIYQSNGDNDTECRSMGRHGPIVTLYDEKTPTKGVRLSYDNGDPDGCQARRSDINLVCADHYNSFEIYKDGSLNHEISRYIVKEPAICEYSITIETAAACPIQCISYDMEKPSISQCNTNGICQYNGAIRCICKDNMVINGATDILCANDNITYSPSISPSLQPTVSPSNHPTISPSLQPTLSPSTLSPTIKAQYSLHGEWTHYDTRLDAVFSFILSVDSLCSYVRFTFISPGCNDVWFGVGIGGDYDIGVSSEDESPKMNGYALITFSGAVPVGYEQSYESTLESGAFPERQRSQDLRDCWIIMENCVQIQTCFRDYESEDTDDFSEFIKGLNPIIWAFGNLSNTQYLPNKHIAAHDSFIYLEGNGECGYAQIVKDRIKTEDDDLWMVIAVIFIVLFAFVALIFLIYYLKTKNRGYIHQRVQSIGDGRGGATQMTSVDPDDDDDHPTKDTAKLL